MLQPVISDMMTSLFLQTRMKANRVEDEARVAVRVAEREAAASRAADDDNFAALRKLKGVEGENAASIQITYQLRQ